LLQTNISGANPTASMDQILQSARKLEQWDINVPDTAKSDSAVLFKVFQNMNSATDAALVKTSIDSAILDSLRSALSKEPGSKAFHAAMRTLGALSELVEVISSRTVKQLNQVLTRMWDFNGNISNRS